MLQSAQRKFFGGLQYVVGALRRSNWRSPSSPGRCFIKEPFALNMDSWDTVVKDSLSLLICLYKYSLHVSLLLQRLEFPVKPFMVRNREPLRTERWWGLLQWSLVVEIYAGSFPSSDVGFGVFFIEEVSFTSDDMMRPYGAPGDCWYSRGPWRQNSRHFIRFLGSLKGFNDP